MKTTAILPMIYALILLGGRDALAQYGGDSTTPSDPTSPNDDDCASATDAILQKNPLLQVDNATVDLLASNFIASCFDNVANLADCSVNAAVQDVDAFRDACQEAGGEPRVVDTTLECAPTITTEEDNGGVVGNVIDGVTGGGGDLVTFQARVSDIEQCLAPACSSEQVKLQITETVVQQVQDSVQQEQGYTCSVQQLAGNETGTTTGASGTAARRTQVNSCAVVLIVALSCLQFVAT